MNKYVYSYGNRSKRDFLVLLRLRLQTIRWGLYDFVTYIFYQ